MELTKEIYTISSDFPKTEAYGLSAQIRRCAISVPSNIAEGHSRNSTKEYLHFLGIAKGSLAELETQITLARMCNYTDENEEQRLFALSSEIGKMLSATQTTLNEKLTLVPNP